MILYILVIILIIKDCTTLQKVMESCKRGSSLGTKNKNKKQQQQKIQNKANKRTLNEELEVKK